MKKLISTLFLGAILTTSVYANNVNVSLNGEYVDAEGIIIEGRTLVPIRAITELLGGEVDWDGYLRQVTVIKENTKMSLIIDDANAIVNNENVELDVPAQIIEDRTFVPLRFVAESFGIDVDFINGVVVMTTETITIYETILEDNITFGAFSFEAPKFWETFPEEGSILFMYEQSSEAYAIVLILSPMPRLENTSLYNSADRAFWEDVILSYAFEAQGIDIQNVDTIGIFEILATDLKIVTDGVITHGISHLLADSDYTISIITLMEYGFDPISTDFYQEFENLIKSFERFR